MSNKFYLALCVAAALFALGACGKKGDLVLPAPGPAPTTTPSHTP
jgi:predicted small lipoprotein YifL